MCASIGIALATVLRMKEIQDQWQKKEEKKKQTKLFNAGDFI